MIRPDRSNINVAFYPPIAHRTGSGGRQYRGAAAAGSVVRSCIFEGCVANIPELSSCVAHKTVVYCVCIPNYEVFDAVPTAGA